MAQLHDVDTTDAQELMDGIEAFAPGDYPLSMESSDRVSTKANDGEYLKCTFIVMDGPMKGRKLFHNFNLWNKNQQATDIAKSQWRALCEATVGQPNAPGNDSTALHYKTFMGEVKVRPAEGNYKASNELVFRKGTIRQISHTGAPVQTQAPPPQPMQNGAAAPQTAPQAAQAPAAPAAPVTPGAGGRPAWAKR